MDNQVEEIKQKLNIIDVINRYVPLKKRGRNYIACCPFHGEKTPSFTVSEEMQIFKCFGCGKAGDIYTFLQEYEHIDFPEALEELAKLAGVTLVKSSFSNQQESLKKTLISINNQITRFYNYILLSHPLGKPALSYLQKRGITPQTIKTFSIGFSPDDSKYISNFFLKKNYKIDSLITTGTFTKSRFGQGLYDRFHNRLTFPLADYRGNTVGFSGRILPDNPNSNQAKYINSPETEIYHKGQMLFGLNLTKEFIRQKNSVIVVEGEFDMISPFQAGFKNIVALKGTAFTKEQLQLLRRYADTLILALDSDFAGNNAALKSIELADSMEFDIQVLDLGNKYKDPDQAVTSDPDFFKKQLHQTLNIWDFILQSQLKIHSPNTVKGKKEILNIVLPFFIRIKNAVVKSDYFKKLADELGSDVESIFQEAAKYQPTETINSKFSSLQSNQEISTEESKTSKFEKLLLTLIIGAKNPPKLAQKLQKYLDQFSVSQFKIIAKYLIQSETKDLKQIATSLPAEFKPLFNDLYFDSQSHSLESKDRLIEIKKAVNNIVKISLKEELNQISSQMTKFENNEDSSEFDKLYLKSKQILEKLNQLQ